MIRAPWTPRCARTRCLATLAPLGQHAPLATLGALLAALTLLGPAPAAHADIPFFEDAPIFKTPPTPSGERSSLYFDIIPEYRARFITIAPLELNGVVAQDVSWAEQRLRLDMTMAYTGIGSIFIQADALDGVLFGDNGFFGSDPDVSSGLGIGVKQGNLATWGVGLLPGGDPLELHGYGPILEPVEPLQFNYLYGEVMLPFGIFRVGRQPISDGAMIAAHDGRDRNRWGVSWYHESVDRVLFGTKLSEAFWLLVDDGHRVDTRMDRGLIWGITYDEVVRDNPHVEDDDLIAINNQLDYKLPDFELFDLDFDFLHAKFTASYRWNDRYGTSLLAMPMMLRFQIEDTIRVETQFTQILGETREISAGFSELTGKDVVMQDINMRGARATVDWLLDDLMVTFEYGYASGDGDPRPSTTQPVTSMSWVRDANMGILLFEHILAYQSARSAAVGIENLRQLEADSFPLTEISTEGRVSNTHSLWPQLFWLPTEGFMVKLGGLFAWTDAAGVDPIQTILAVDGVELDDDALNYHGGKPGSYWGTELMFGFEMTYKQMFKWVIESAVLLPGDALEDENGDAVHSWFFESRFVFKL